MAVDDSGFHRHPAGGLVPVEFARRLERERDEAREVIKQLKGVVIELKGKLQL